MKKCFLIFGLLCLVGYSQPNGQVGDAVYCPIGFVQDNGKLKCREPVSYHEETKCLVQEWWGTSKLDIDKCAGRWPNSSKACDFSTHMICTKYDKKRCYITVNGEDHELSCPAK